ncbi:head-tail connector protein [Paraburkholderia bannensis]|uniref:hypothetical protein n=1 Tax=Paraburkholderia bannensis TaxID=765414 RepID=UPI002ABE7391|nr:hypothetical protein [Paraburkholderia bannensis]
MAAVLVAYIDDAEPLTFEDVDSQCRIDDDEERQFVQDVVIPGARQAAESQSGAAIRKARYVERLPGFPQGEFPLSLGQVLSIESVEYRDTKGVAQTLDPGAYELVQYGKESALSPTSIAPWPWPHARTVTITYQAGTDLTKFPSVRSWMLLAAALAYEQRELFAVGQSRQAIVEIPDGYAEYLLAPITVPPRF